MDRIISDQKLIAFEKELFTKLGFTPEGSEIAARCLTDADLRGVASHGALRLPIYTKRIKAGVVLPDAPVDVAVDFGAIAVIDGHNTLGQISSVRAMNIALEKARQFGIAAVGVRHSHHYGTAAYYAQMAAEAGMIGISTTNTNPLMPPVGGLARKVGNNPLSIAVPAGEQGVLNFDMACSTVAQGKLQVAAKKGQEIPLGWATDKDGNPTTDAAKAIAGFLSPVGGHKGFGLAMMLDLLSGPLVGSECGPGVTMLTGVYDRFQNCGHLFIVINLEKFCEPGAFRKKVDQYVEYIRDCPVIPGQKVFMPGEIEQTCKQTRLRDGIPFPELVVADIEELALSEGMQSPFK